MKGTFTLPDGSKVRTSSQRRFVVFTTGGIYDASGFAQRWGVYARSDSLDTARRRRRSTADVILDTHTGEVVR